MLQIDINSRWRYLVVGINDFYLVYPCFFFPPFSLEYLLFNGVFFLPFCYVNGSLNWEIFWSWRIISLSHRNTMSVCYTCSTDLLFEGVTDLRDLISRYSRFQYYTLRHLSFILKVLSILLDTWNAFIAIFNLFHIFFKFCSSFLINKLTDIII